MSSFHTFEWKARTGCENAASKSKIIEGIVGSFILLGLFALWIWACGCGEWLGVLRGDEEGEGAVR